MTLAKPETEYQFTAPIVGKSKRGSAWALEFDWKFPGSRFNLIVYERKDEVVEMWNIGDSPKATITQGTLKQGKDGKYPTDYFYDLVTLEGAEAAPAQIVGAAVPASHQEQNARGYDLGMAFNKAVDLVAATYHQYEDTPAPEYIVQDIRYWRDRLLRDVILQPPAPEHFCYIHNAELRHNPKTNKWGHVLPGNKGCGGLTGVRPWASLNKSEAII